MAAEHEVDPVRRVDVAGGKLVLRQRDAGGAVHRNDMRAARAAELTRALEDMPMSESVMDDVRRDRRTNPQDQPVAFGLQKGALASR